MRIVHVAPTALSNISAAWRIKKAQREIGLDAVAAVQLGENSDHVFTFEKDEAITLRKKRFFERVDSIPIRMSINRNLELPWSSAWTGRNVSSFINNLDPDIVNFHWLTNGSVNLTDLRYIKCPVVFTLHDVWAMTGGCHCNLECNNWKSECHSCPQLGKSLLGFEFAPLLRMRKVSAYAQIPNLTVVSPSRWLAKIAKESKCFPNSNIKVIQNCLDVNLFTQGDKTDARLKLRLPLNKIIIGFGAVNATSVSYKGYDLLRQIMHLLRQRGVENLHLVVFGDNDDGSFFPYDVSFLGIKDCEKDLSIIYQAFDIFLSPSRQDNFPSTVMEATACGTPVVAFAIGGIADIVKHKVSGYLSKPFDVNDFADGVQWVMGSAERLSSIGQAAYDFTSTYCAPNTVARKYLKLYHSLIK